MLHASVDPQMLRLHLAQNKKKKTGNMFSIQRQSMARSVLKLLFETSALSQNPMYIRTRFQVNFT
jgi:hypothetical protein